MATKGMQIIKANTSIVRDQVVKGLPSDTGAGPKRVTFDESQVPRIPHEPTKAAVGHIQRGTSGQLMTKGTVSSSGGTEMKQGKKGDHSNTKRPHQYNLAQTPTSLGRFQRESHGGARQKTDLSKPSPLFYIADNGDASDCSSVSDSPDHIGAKQQKTKVKYQTSLTGGASAQMKSDSTSSITGLKLRPINIVDPMHSKPTEDTHGKTGASQSLPDMSPEHIQLGIPMGFKLGGALDMSDPGGDCVGPFSPNTIKTQLRSLLEEKTVLRSELDKQVEVNLELKKLLVASLGDDLQYRMERMARDKASLALQVGDYSKKVTQDTETLESLSIQADMWRSKYMASRVMVEELAEWKAHLFLQYRESQAAVLKLLEERQVLKIKLMDTYKNLKTLQDGFDPKNAHQTPTHHAFSLMTVVKTIQQLAYNVKYRLLGPLPDDTSAETASIQDLTEAEEFANKVLSNTTIPQDEEGLQNLCAPPVYSAPRSQVIGRFHPSTRFEQLTFCSCKHCSGEIQVV
ncbi:golgin-45-like [Lingula anatina]|uniref:Golgin-45-like n=1 Tax=Lingula anatina TaxID=7574 RepID=A0A1S3HGV0_LINAN|nr:golgin-45-like [Lingula anatina]|eukprot:XP_013384244.1 golgin-45-like [Lingula anatina]